MKYDGYIKYDAAVAASYDADRENEEHWVAENEFITNYASANGLGTVLDIPVGTGRLLGPLRTAEHIVGIDVSEDMLSEAERTKLKLGLDHVRLAHGDALALECADDAFDTVVCFRLLHLVPPEWAPRLLKELARVCRGRILLQIYGDVRPSNPGLRQRIAKMGGRLTGLFGKPRRGRPWSHIQSYAHSTELILEWVQSSGLRVIHRHHLGAYEGASVEVLELAE